MAEALGITGIIAALTQLADYTWKLGSALYDFSRDAGGAMKEIQNFANIATSFSNVISTARFSLKMHWDELSNSPVLDYVVERRVLEGIAKLSHGVRRNLRSSRKQLFSGSLAKRYPVVLFIKWTYQKGPILALLPVMEVVKSDLHLVVSILFFEVLGRKADDKEGRREKEMEELRELIRAELKANRRLDDQIQETQLQSLLGSASTAPISSSHEHLVRLGRSMVATGRVPRNSRRRRSPRRRSPRRTSNSSPTRTSNSHADRATSGYVKSPAGKVTAADAVLVPTQDGNVIGLAFARKLDLDVEPHLHGERVLVSVGNGNTEPSIGKLTLEWTASESPRRPPIIVQCSVVENSQINLVLGKRFIDRLDELWQQPRNGSRTR